MAHRDDPGPRVGQGEGLSSSMARSCSVGSTGLTRGIVTGQILRHRRAISSSTIARRCPVDYEEQRSLTTPVATSSRLHKGTKRGTNASIDETVARCPISWPSSRFGNRAKTVQYLIAAMAARSGSSSYCCAVTGGRYQGRAQKPSAMRYGWPGRLWAVRRAVEVEAELLLSGEETCFLKDLSNRRLFCGRQVGVVLRCRCGSTRFSSLSAWMRWKTRKGGRFNHAAAVTHEVGVGR